MELSEAESKLQQWFSYCEFKPGQWDIIKAVLQGKQVISIQKTGFGKSICFQFPAMLFSGLCLVYSPLIALMRQQTDWLQMRGIPAACINSQQSSSQNEKILQQVVKSQIKILYIAPERLNTHLWQKYLRHLSISFIVIDEAHCISTWSHDFRPAYRHIMSLLSTFIQLPPILALTATATTEVIEDIRRQLGPSAEIIRGPIQRENLQLNVIRIRTQEEKTSGIIQLVNSLPGHGLIYAMTRTNTELMAGELNRQGISAAYYHAGLDPYQRQKIENGFYENQWKCVVTTCALGMGIDKPDIRFIIHTHCPSSLTDYFQEIGRAGRDNAEAFIYLFYHPRDRYLQESFIQNYRPDLKYYKMVYSAQTEQGRLVKDVSSELSLKPSLISMICNDLADQSILEMEIGTKGVIWKIINNFTSFDYQTADQIRHHKFNQLVKMIQYIQTSDCRMNFICRYLGETHEWMCGHCDNDVNRRFHFQGSGYWKNKIKSLIFWT